MESKQKKVRDWRKYTKRDWECDAWLDRFNDLMGIKEIDEVDEYPRRKKEEWNPSRR